MFQSKQAKLFLESIQYEETELSECTMKVPFLAGGFLFCLRRATGALYLWSSPEASRIGLSTVQRKQQQ